MAEKDIAEKILLSYADVFADCENALVYHGRQILQPEELFPAPTESFYYGAGGENHYPGDDTKKAARNRKGSRMPMERAACVTSSVMSVFTG